MLIKQYIRNKKNHPIGVLLACLNANNELCTGWSLCSKYDRWDKAKGDRIAVGRLARHTNVPVPNSIEKEFVKFLDRCNRYFAGRKDA